MGRLRRPGRLTRRCRPRVLGEVGAIAAPAPERGQEVESRPLEPEGHEREVDFVQVLVEEHCDLEQRPRREPRDAHPSVSLEAEERSQPLLASPGRAELDEEVRDPGFDVPQAVRRAGRGDDDFTGADDAGSSAQAEAKRA